MHLFFTKNYFFEFGIIKVGHIVLQKDYFVRMSIEFTVEKYIVKKVTISISGNIDIDLYP